MNNKKTALAAALSAALGLGAVAAAPGRHDFCKLVWPVHPASPSGVVTANTCAPYAYDPTWGYGRRTQISGTFSFNTSTGIGTATATVNVFDIFGGGPFIAHDITLQAIGDGVGGAGTLVAAGILFDWNSGEYTDVGIILDAAGFFGALPASGSTTISGVGALPASNGISSGTLPIGPVPMATMNLPHFPGHPVKRINS